MLKITKATFRILRGSQIVYKQVKQISKNASCWCFTNWWIVL